MKDTININSVMKEQFGELFSIADKLNDIVFDESVEEADQDEAYEQFWVVLRKIADVIVEVTDGKIDKETALKMAARKRKEILRPIFPCFIPIDAPRYGFRR